MLLWANSPRKSDYVNWSDSVAIAVAVAIAIPPAYSDSLHQLAFFTPCARENTLIFLFIRQAAGSRSCFPCGFPCGPVQISHGSIRTHGSVAIKAKRKVLDLFSSPSSRHRIINTYASPLHRSSLGRTGFGQIYSPADPSSAGPRRRRRLNAVLVLLGLSAFPGRARPCFRGLGCTTTTKTTTFSGSSAPPPENLPACVSHAHCRILPGVV
ncbi:hypothetical protein P8C59_004733 [Phyllachora maydis]|uniref:Uncharacterized protein n=1 Tax=Phyllachora maydis TaxID=1825666 RepID=A0AAD9I483_9PEZI|nr:hypothetical protein P8C59_004733 [Phyllachora maydis]